MLPQKSALFLVVIITTSLCCYAFGEDRGLKLYKGSRYSEALREYDRIIKDHPDCEEAHFGKGAALYKLDRIEEAMREFEKAISTKDPLEKSAVFYNIGNSFFTQGRIQESMEFYKRALRLNPSDFDAKYNYELAKLLLHQMSSQSQEGKEGGEQQETERQNLQSQQSDDTESHSQDRHQDRSVSTEEEGKLEEATQILDALRDNEKRLIQERMRAKYSGIEKEKDW